MSKTWSTILAQVRYKLKEPYASKWSDAILLSCANEAEREIAKDFDLVLTRDATTDTVSGTQEYALPTNFRYALEDKGVIYTDASSNESEVYFRYKRDLIGEFSDFLTKTGTPTYYYIENNNIGFYPIPNYSGTNNLVLNGVYDAGQMTSTASTSVLPDILFDAFVYKICANAYMYQNNPYNEVVAKSMEMFNVSYKLESQKVAANSSIMSDRGIRYFGR